MEYYLRVEAVNLANFIYDTTDLSTVRGGGLLLLDAIKRIEKRFEQLHAISTGASSGLFSFAATNLEKAQTLQKEISDFLNHEQELKHATFVIDTLPASNTFNEDKEKLLVLNRWQQIQSPTLVVAENDQQNPEYPLCAIDHVRPSANCDEKGHGKPIVSESVFQRRNYGREQKQKFYEQQTGLENKFTHDLTELTDDEDDGKNQGNLNGKMAVIYLDGNSFSGLQRELDKEGLQDFDKTIKEYRREFLHDLLFEITQTNDSAWFYGSKIRLETLLWGGDELMLVVPAWQGCWTMNLFFEASKQWEFRGKSLTHAAGLVFCHHNAPIHRITGLAKQLGDLAKDKKDEKGNKIGRRANYVAYQVLESFDHTCLDVEKFRQDSLGSSGLKADELIIRGDQMGQLGKRMVKVKTVLAKGRVYKIIDAILRNKPTEELIENAISKADLPDSPRLKKATFWLHIIELWDYIKKTTPPATEEN